MNKIRRLIVDIETSPDVVFSWTTGWKLMIPATNIIQERAIIAIGFKWHGEKETHCLTWNKGKDKQMLKKFAKVLERADEVIGYNSDKFDLRWIRARCLFHGIPVVPQIVGVDVYKIAKRYFLFNSNKLEYVAKFIGAGEKMETGGFNLWKEVVLHNDPKALEKMVKYCKNDVEITEEVYNKLEGYGAIVTHAGVLSGGLKRDCPKCASVNTQKRGLRVTAAGSKMQSMQCMDCGRWYSVSMLAAKEVR